MTDLELIKPSDDYIDEIQSYRLESLVDSDHIHGASGLSDFANTSDWIEHCRLGECKETIVDPEQVEGDQYLLVNKCEHRVLGMICFRHSLNEYLSEYAGHIGYSIRPCERCKGYAKTMLMLCLDKCRDFGLSRVLLTCGDRNLASRRTILSCGGVFERLTLDESNLRFWIEL